MKHTKARSNKIRNKSDKNSQVKSGGLQKAGKLKTTTVEV